MFKYGGKDKVVDESMSSGTASKQKSRLEAVAGGFAEVLRTPFPREEEEEKTLFYIGKDYISGKIRITPHVKLDGTYDSRGYRQLSTHSLVSLLEKAQRLECTPDEFAYAIVEKLGGTGDTVKFAVKPLQISELLPKAEQIPISEFIKLVENSENHSATSEIRFRHYGSKVRVLRSVISTSPITYLQHGFAENIVDYVKGEDSDYFFSLEGAKGSGKSFVGKYSSAMLILEGKKVAYISFDNQGDTRLLPGYSKPTDADLVIIDEIHKLFDKVKKGEIDRSALDSLADFLKSLRDLGKKVVLISDQPLTWYAEQLGNEKLKQLMSTRNLNIESHELDTTGLYTLSKINRKQGLGLDNQVVASISHTLPVLRFMILVSQNFENAGDVHALAESLKKGEGLEPGLEPMHRFFLSYPLLSKASEAEKVVIGLGMDVRKGMDMIETSYAESVESLQKQLSDKSAWDPEKLKAKENELMEEEFKRDKMRLERYVGNINDHLAEIWDQTYVAGFEPGTYVLGTPLISPMKSVMKEQLALLLRDGLRAK